MSKKDSSLTKLIFKGLLVRLLTPFLALVLLFLVVWLGSINRTLMLLVFFLISLFIIFVGYITITDQRKILLRNWFLKGLFWKYNLLTKGSKFWRLFYGWLFILLGVAFVIFIIQALWHG